MLPVLPAPVAGVADPIPVMVVVVPFGGGSRVVAFRRGVRWPHVRTVMRPGMPACLLATDAIASLVMGLAKVARFGSLQRLQARPGAIGVAARLCAVPGAFVARTLIERMHAPPPAAIIEAVVAFGACSVLRRAAMP